MALLKALFDKTTGERVTTYVEGIHFEIVDKVITPPLPDGVITISDADQALYTTNLYVLGNNGKPVLRSIPVETIEEASTRILLELDEASANAYISGFYSDCTGANMYFDSDLDSQKLVSNIYTRTKEDDWGTLVRYPNVAPAGYAPIRARASEESSESEKVVLILDASQIKKLIDDMDLAFFNIKLKLWQKQAAVNTALKNNDIATIQSIKW